MIYKNGLMPKNSQNKHPRCIGQSLYSELIQLRSLEIPNNNKGRSKPESRGKIRNLEEHKELKRLEESF